jgi:DNA-binding NtrC family response regulator
MSKNSRSLRVLVVDDELLLRWSVVETLTDSGFEVVTANDGAGAVEAVGTEPFDVALLDVRLPDNSDLTLLAHLRRLASGIPIVLMTAHSTPEMVEDALTLGAYCVLSKPFDMDALADVVTQAALS